MITITKQMITKFLTRLSLERPTEKLVLGNSKRVSFRVVTDNSFGGKSLARFEENRFFRGELRGDIPFAAIRGELPSDLQDIGDFEGFSLRVRSIDDRRFSFNLQPPTIIPQDLYQGFIVLPSSNQFYTLVLPFKSMLLTGKGKAREIQRKLDSTRIQTIGFSVGGPGSKPGPFELEIEFIKWINDIRGIRV